MIGRLHHVTLDCEDPALVAEFYAELLGQPVTYRSDSYCVVAEDAQSSGLAFQLAADHVATTWPAPGVPQQVHLDVMVDDVDAAGKAVLRLGARHLDAGVYADPSGHPFCLIPRPPWAEPISAT